MDCLVSVDDGANYVAAFCDSFEIASWILLRPCTSCTYEDDIIIKLRDKGIGLSNTFFRMPDYVVTGGVTMKAYVIDDYDLVELHNYDPMVELDT